MKRLFYYLIFVSLTILLIGTLQAIAKPDREKTIRENQLKSRYYYYEGLARELNNEPDAAYESYKKAVALDSTNTEALYGLGLMRQAINILEMQMPAERRTSMEMMHDFVDFFPDDINENILYSYLKMHNDDVEESIRVLERLSQRYPDRSEPLIYLSDAYSTNGRFEDAIEVMNRYEKLEGRTSALTIHKMSMYLESKDTLGALREVNSLIAYDPDDYTSYILKGNLYEMTEQRDSAEALYLQAERMAPEASEPKLALLDILREKGDSVAHDNKVYEVLLTEDLNVESKTAILYEYFQKLFQDKHDISRGEYLFGVLEKQYPHDAEVQDLAARFNAAKGDYKKATEHISYALDMEPANLAYWHQMMYYQLATEDREGALDTYQRAVDSGIADRNLKLYGGMIMQESKDFDKARNTYISLIHEIDSNLNVDKDLSISDLRKDISVSELDFISDVLTTMGDCAIAASDTLEAYRNYTNALTLNPGNALAANNYAYFSSISGGDLGKAEELSRRCITEDNSGNPTYLDTLAWILYLRGKTEEAAELQERAVNNMIEMGREEGTLYAHYGDILYKLGKIEEAIKYWKLAVDKDSDDKNLPEKIKNGEKELQSITETK